MAKSPIVFYIAETGEDTFVGGPELLEAFGLSEEALIAAGAVRHEVHLKPQFKQSMQIEVERAISRYDAMTGVQTKDEEKRAGAMVEVYVESWTLPQSPSLVGFNELPPNVAAYVAQSVNNRVFGGLAASSAFFQALNAKQKNSSTPSENVGSESGT